MAQDALAQFHGMQAQKLSDTDEHPNEGCGLSAYESDKGSAAGRQKQPISAIAYNMQPESPTSEGLILIHSQLMIMHM